MYIIFLRRKLKLLETSVTSITSQVTPPLFIAPDILIRQDILVGVDNPVTHGVGKKAIDVKVQDANGFPKPVNWDNDPVNPNTKIIVQSNIETILNAKIYITIGE